MIFTKILNNAKYVFLGLFVLVLVLVFGRFFRNWSFPDATWTLEKGEKMSISEEKEKEAIQKFTSAQNNLSRIDILFGSSKIGKGGTLDLEIFDKNCDTKMRESRIRTKEIDSDKFFTFSFAKIPDSKDQIFCLKLSFSDWEKDKTRSAQVFTQENTTPSNIYFAIGEEVFEGRTVSMRPAYQESSFIGNIQTSIDRISQYKPPFLKDTYLLLITLSFVIISIITVLILILS